MNRRDFLKHVHSIPVFATLAGRSAVEAQAPIKRIDGARLKLSCNLYSFNTLSNGEMTLDQALEFCAQAGFDVRYTRRLTIFLAIQECRERLPFQDQAEGLPFGA